MAGPPDSDTTSRRRSKKSPAHLFEFTLARLPELDLFPSEEMRQIAFERIARQAGSSLRSIAAGILICAGAAGTVVFGLRWLIPLLPFPAGINRWLAALAPGIGGIATFFAGCAVSASSRLSSRAPPRVTRPGRSDLPALWLPASRASCGIRALS